MKKFHFALERVRDWRRQQADVEKGRLQPLMTERAALGAELDRIVLEETETRQALVPTMPLYAQELAAHHAYRLHLQDRKRDAGARISACDIRIDSQLKVIREAQRKLRLLERLEERRRGEWS